MKLVALTLGALLATAGCGTRTTDRDLAALLAGVREAPAAQAAATAPPTTTPPAAAAPAAGPGAAPVTSPPHGGASAATASTPEATAPAAVATRPAARAGASAPPAAANAPPRGAGPAAPAPTPGAPPAAAACPGNESPIIIGSVGTYSGIVGQSVHGGVRAVQAWAARVNTGGGLHCHPVRYIEADDGGDTARNQALTRRLVEQEKVIAFVYDGAPVTAQASAAYLNEKQVPEVGQEGGHMFTYDSAMHFPIGPAGVAIQRLTLAGGARATLPEARKVAVVTCQEIEYCNTAEKTYQEYAASEGQEVVYRAKVALTQPDFTSVCLGAQNAGAKAVLPALDSNSHQRLMASCAKVGYHPVDVLTTVQMSADFKTDSNMDGAVIVSNNLPWFLADNPAIADYQTTLRQYAPGAPFDASSTNGWVAAKAFELALRALPPAQAPTSRDVLGGLYGFNGEDLGGMVQPLRFTPGKPARPVACGWVVRLTKGQFGSDGQRFCVKGLEP
jgi:branched-chain amino acid transport system substrate-binding protein